MSDQAPRDANLPQDGTPLADRVLERCVRIVANCNRFKQPRLAKIALYRDLYAGKVKKKYRQPFNVVLPVFAGSMDTLMASFNDDLSVDLTEQEPADYLPVRKINTVVQMELTSEAPNAKFALKTRQDRSNALFSGRGFMANYAVDTPEYRNNFEIFELEDAIFEPTGGGHWANHRYAGRQDLVRSESELKEGTYDQAQVQKLLDNAAKTDFDVSFQGDEAAKAGLAKFKAMGIAPESNDYVGETLFKLADMRINVGGKKYYIVFSPYYKVWLRFGLFKDLCSAEIDPWVSWATHEDNKNFLSKSYADDMYSIADATHTLFNQELTNREKRNFNARGYDIDMFPDVAKLDQAQTRPDALVPVKVAPGKRIQDGIFTFETAELQGTINLISWMRETEGLAIGVNDLAMGGSQGVTKRATVVLAEQQAIAKRMLLRASSYTEAMSEVVKLIYQGMKDHMPASMALKRLGTEGEGWDATIRRADLDLYSDIDIKITSSSIEMKNSQMKKEARDKILQEIAIDPLQSQQVNPRWIVEEKLRSIGEYDDATIAIAMDVKNYGNKEEEAHAYEAIQDVQNGKKAQTYYGATTLFMQIIHDFAVNNRGTLGDAKFNALIDFAMAHQPIAQDNMLRKASQAKPAVPVDPNAPAGPNAPAPGPQLAPNVPSASAQIAAVPAR